MLQPGVRDPRLEKVQAFESFQPLEIYQPGVGDLGVSKVQVLELAQSPKMGHVAIRDVGVVQGHEINLLKELVPEQFPQPIWPYWVQVRPDFPPQPEN